MKQNRMCMNNHITQAVGDSNKCGTLFIHLLLKLPNVDSLTPSQAIVLEQISPPCFTRSSHICQGSI